MPSSSRPNVPQVSSPSDFTARTISLTKATSVGFGPRHAAPMQKRLAPRDWAILAFSTTSATSSISDFSTPVW